MSILEPAEYLLWDWPVRRRRPAAQRQPGRSRQADQAVQKLQADQVRLNSGDLDDSIETDFRTARFPTGIPTDGCPGNDRRSKSPRATCGRRITNSSGA